MSITLPKKITLVSGLTVFMLSMSVNAASQCKGLDSDSCAAEESCGWVESYTRKDGRVVNSFCRTSSKGKKKPVAATPVTDKAT